MKNCPGQRVYNLYAPESMGVKAHLGSVESSSTLEFDALSSVAYGVLLVSTSVLLYALVPAFGFDPASSVAGHILSGGESDPGMALWRVFDVIAEALE